MSAVKKEILLPLTAGEAATTMPILSTAAGAVLNSEEAVSADWYNLREEKEEGDKESSGTD
jgi:Na+(H+)/acetate symporter ActP